MHMQDGMIAFVSILLLGMVIYGSLWWQGNNLTLRITKWFAIITLVGALIGGGYFAFAGLE